MTASLSAVSAVRRGSAGAHEWCVPAYGARDAVRFPCRLSGYAGVSTVCDSVLGSGEPSHGGGIMGLLDGGHARALRAAQNLWDRDRRAEAIATLDGEVPGLMPRLFSTDALIVATLATYLMQTGDPRRGLKLLEAVPLGERPRTDVQAICLSARCCCRAAAGNLAGAHDDRAAIFRAM